MTSTRIASLLLFCVLAATGCDKGEEKLAAEKKAADRAKSEQYHAAQTAEREQKWLDENRQLVVGKWAAQMGKPADGFYSEMSLDVRADGTFTLVNAMHRPAANGRPAQPSVVNTSEGSWEATRDELILTLLRSVDGRPIDPDKREYRLTFASDKEGQRISILAHDFPKGAKFRRQ